MDLETIKRLRELKEKKEKIEEQIKSTSIINDIYLIRKIFEMFSNIVGGDFSPMHCSIDNRKKFFLVIISLYCPMYFTGSKMSWGVRKEIASLFKYNSQTNVSNLCHNAVDQYLIYKDFRLEINPIIDEIVSRLKKEGCI